MILHIATGQDYEECATGNDGEYRPARFARDGFIHCSTEQQVVRIANHMFRGTKGLKLLHIDENSVADALRFEDPGCGEPFPHVYRPFTDKDIIAVYGFEPGGDGEFQLPSGLWPEEPSLREALSQMGDRTVCPVAIITRGDKVLLGLRHYTADKWKDISVWTAPGGRCEDGETVEETLRRETYEETGIRNLDIRCFMGEVAGAKEGDRLLMFEASADEEPALMEPDKFSEWRWFRPAEIPSNIINERARDAILKLFESKSS